jgi:hypothetical protein
MATSIPLLETLEITLSSTGVAELAFNRPARYNALNPLAYRVCNLLSVKEGEKKTLNILNRIGLLLFNGLLVVLLSK